MKMTTSCRALTHQTVRRCNRSARRLRLGSMHLSSLDMLTCCLGAVLLLWLASAADNRTSKGVVSGVFLSFHVHSGVPAKIGVRVSTTKGLTWAGDEEGDRTVTISPQVEGSSSVKVFLNGEYGPNDQIHLFVNEVDQSGWSVVGNQDTKVRVSFRGDSFVLPLSRDHFAWSMSLDGIRERKSMTINNWNNNGRSK